MQKEELAVSAAAKRWIRATTAAWVLIAGFGLLALMQVLILLEVLPADFVWGGSVTSDARRILLGVVALAVIALFVWITARRAGLVGTGQPGVGVKIGAWVIVAYLALNILGNLASSVSAERIIFAPLALVMAVMALRVALE